MPDRPHQPRYVGPPGPDIDEAWKRLVSGQFQFPFPTISCFLLYTFWHEWDMLRCNRKIYHSVRRRSKRGLGRWVSRLLAWESWWISCWVSLVLEFPGGTDNNGRLKDFKQAWYDAYVTLSGATALPSTRECTQKDVNPILIYRT